MSTATLDTPQSNLLTEPQAAQYLGVCHATLRQWRYQKRGPSYSRLGTWKGIRYRLSDLQEWLKSREKNVATLEK